MPWCVRCGQYGQTANFRRLPQKQDKSITNYVCKDRAVCRERVTSSDLEKGKGEPRSGSLPADIPNMLERARLVYQLIRDGEIDGVLGLSYIVWPPDMDTAQGTPGRDKTRRRAA